MRISYNNKSQADHNIQTSSRQSESRQFVGGKKKSNEMGSRYPNSEEKG